MNAPRPGGARVIPLPARHGARVPPHAPADAAAGAAAQESAARGAHRRRLWLRETQIIAGSYALNALCLALFVMAGTVPWHAAVLYVLPGWLCCATAAWVIGSGRTQHWDDPSISTVQSGVAILICGAGIALYPQLTFVYTLILFTVFLSATYRTPKVQIHAAWAVVVVLIALSTLVPGRSLQIPHASTLEEVATWACFTLTLSRCVLLSVINSGHNQLLRDRSRQMGETLAQIERLANHDELTGLHNRRCLLRTLGEEIDRASRQGTPLSVALLDIDHFKGVNDRFGHVAGDRTLRAFADAVQARRRNTDHFGRYGGEEFLLVMPDTDARDADRALGRLREAFDGHDWSGIAPSLDVRFSAGVATWHAGEALEQLLSRADRGLYGAKHAGRNCHRAG